MVILIEDLHRHKGYKIDTLMLAVSIADRYLVNLAVGGQKAPCLAILATTVLLIAVKLEEPIAPCFNLMISLLPSPQKYIITRQMLIDLEEKILRALNFDFTFTGPLVFLERY